VETLKHTFDSLLKEKKGAVLVDVLIELDKLIWKSFQGFADEEKISQAREKFRTMVVHLGLSLDECPKDASAMLAPLINILLDVRGKLRGAKQWALADEVRNQLVHAGIIVEDTPRGPQWRIKS
jgi:cysteinyl-tRNA synthetase